MVLALAVPVNMADPDDWAYYYGVQNFAQEQFTVDSATHSQQVSEAQQQGGQLIQYVNIGDNIWALEKAPGYVLYLIPFELAGIPRWGNVLLALGMIIVTYILLKRMRDEKAAMIGSLLMLLTPLSLVMLNRAYMDTYASLAFLVMGGGLYMYYHLGKEKFGKVKGGVILFLAFFLTGWSVVSRYTNFPIAFVIALHFIITRIIQWYKKDRARIRREIIPVVMGIGLAVAALLLYDYFVFGSALDYGYHYTKFGIKFAFQYLGQINQSGQSVPWEIIWGNLQNAPRALMLAFPLLAVGIPAFISILYFKFRAIKKRGEAMGRWSSLHTEIPWNILWILIGWFVFVFGLYLTYEWTADFQGAGAWVTFSRFYLPGLFPVAVISALVLSRLPMKIWIPITTVLVGFGSLLYMQSVLNLNFLPSWLTGGGAGRGGFDGRGGDMPSDGGYNLPGGNGVRPPGASGNNTPGYYPGGNPPGGSGNYNPGYFPGGNPPGVSGNSTPNY